MCHSPTRPVLCSISQGLHLPFQLSERTGLPSELPWVPEVFSRV